MSQQDSKSASIGYNGCGCLVFLIFLGIIAAGYLQFFPQNRNSSIFPEAPQYISSMNKSQQAYFAEKSAFATSVDALGLSLKTERPNYKYSLRTTKKAAFNYGVSKQKDFKSYVGGVFVIRLKPKADDYTATILCIADQPGTIKPAEPIYQNGKISCGKDTTQVTK